MRRDLDLIKEAKQLEYLHAAKARFYAQRAGSPELRQICEKAFQQHEDHMGRLDALEHQLGQRVTESPYQSVTDQIRFRPS